MQSTTTMLREEARTVPLASSPGQLAATLDALAGYEQIALTSAATMMADPAVAELRTAVCTAQDAADLAAVTRRLLTHNTPAGSAVVRSMLETLVLALDRSARTGARHLDIRASRLQAEAAAEAAHRCRQLRTALR